jgi:hypothetical protein
MFKFNENIQEFSEINALYQHSAKTIDKFLENNDLYAIIFYCKKTFSKEEMTEDNVEEVIVDFVNYVCDNNLQPKYPSPLYLADTIKNVIDFYYNIEFGNIATFNEDGVFFIENTINETRCKVSAYFGSRIDALAGLSECADWFRPNGTGEIYFQPYGIGTHPIFVMKVY